MPDIHWSILPDSLDGKSLEPILVDTPFVSQQVLPATWQITDVIAGQ